MKPKKGDVLLDIQLSQKDIMNPLYRKMIDSVTIALVGIFISLETLKTIHGEMKMYRQIMDIREDIQ